MHYFSQAGIYSFWYCNIHDDGIIKLNFVYAHAHVDQLSCGLGCQCNYVNKGILEYDGQQIKIIKEIQKTFDKESGNFKFEYYFNHFTQNNVQY